MHKQSLIFIFSFITTHTAFSAGNLSSDARAYVENKAIGASTAGLSHIIPPEELARQRDIGQESRDFESSNEEIVAREAVASISISEDLTRNSPLVLYTKGKKVPQSFTEVYFRRNGIRSGGVGPGHLIEISNWVRSVKIACSIPLNKKLLFVYDWRTKTCYVDQVELIQKRSNRRGGGIFQLLQLGKYPIQLVDQFGGEQIVYLDQMKEAATMAKIGQIKKDSH